MGDPNRAGEDPTHYIDVRIIRHQREQLQEYLSGFGLELRPFLEEFLPIAVRYNRAHTSRNSFRMQGGSYLSVPVDPETYKLHPHLRESVAWDVNLNVLLSRVIIRMPERRSEPYSLELRPAFGFGEPSLLKYTGRNVVSNVERRRVAD